MALLEIFLIAIILVLIVFLFLFYKKNSQMEEQLNLLSFSKSSQSVKYGKMTEQWIPFSKDFPHNSENFRFLGSPIDGIVFNDDKIIFCEFKSNTSKLSEKQKRIKSLVESKKIEWLEFFIK
ncbi:MAG: Holliday junction resolvase-like protein [archaeon]|nr:Holliday junction resolvase-like protein [archaeon]